MFVYVDDFFIIESKNFNQIEKLKKNLNKRFEIIDLKSCNHYLNITITRNWINKIFHFSQKIYIEKIFVRFDMQNCKFFAIFMNMKINLKIVYDYNVIVKKIKFYQIQIKSFIYFVMQTKFDITQIT